jgi:hypothetical protein
LPALEDVRITRKMILVEAFICLYRVVESLLLELYDEISEGEIITDSIIIKKVKTLL